MVHAEFVHLHLHTEYSLLDGAIRIPELCRMAREHKAPAIAVTDHGNLFGAIEFYHQAQKHGVKPIIGCEAYIAPESRFEKNSRMGGEYAFHIVLLAKNQIGYTNLMKLITAGHLEGFHYRPRIDKELLSAHNQGLIALSACLRGEVNHYLLIGEKRRAREAAATYKDIFGDRYYLEIQENGIPEQAVANQGLAEISVELEVPLVATGDCHYLTREEASAHDVLLCIQTGKTVKDGDRMSFRTQEFYLKSPDEMKAAFASWPDAIKRTMEIAERCNLSLDSGGYHLPRYQVPEGYTLESYLSETARNGLSQRLKALKHSGKEEERYRDRLEGELKTINSMGLAGYLLIVADFINFAKGNGIPVGPGRGSAAGSLTAYALRITEIDPIATNLLFERFLNEGRKSLPDIDVDFCIDRRDEVIRYVADKYGKDRVAQITTFGTMQARAAIRDVGRALDIPYNEVDRIAKLVPATLNISLDEALSQEPRLREVVEKNEEGGRLMETAKRLEGLARHASTHAAGVVISDRPLTELTPLYKGPKGEVLTQYDMNSLEKIGLIKFDFLGLKTLTVIDKAVKIIKQSRGIELDMGAIDGEDKETFASLARGDTSGVFQLEGRGITDMTVRLRPGSIEDIAALIALYRPGPLQSGMVDDFIQRKHGRVPISYELPQLKDILEETYGVIVYQEQVMKIATELASFTPQEADLLRHAMGKKIPEEMARQKELFIKGAKKNGIGQRKAERIFDLIAHFAGYGFNKSHSAAYAVISYQTAYLKTHYPLEFMAALLSQEVENSDKVMRYIGECRSKGIEVLPPDVNESLGDFAVVGGKIRFGLAAVKNVGLAAVETVVEARESGGAFSSLGDFCRRVDLRKVNRRVVESLTKAGAFDSCEVSRSAMLEELSAALGAGQSHQRDREGGQIALFGGQAKARREGLQGHSSSPDTPGLRLAYEKEVLGLYLSDHPLRPYLEAVEALGLKPIAELNDMKDGTEVEVAGMVSDLKQKFTKKGSLMAFFKLEDLDSRVEVIVFSDLYRGSATLLEGGRPVAVKGVVDAAEEGVKLKATRISPIQKEKVRGNVAVMLHLREGELDQSKAQALKEVVASCPGESPAFLCLRLNHGKEAVIALDERVAASQELCERLRALFGYEVVEIKEGNG